LTEVAKNADGTMTQNEMMEPGSADTLSPDLVTVYDFTGSSTDR